MEFDIRIDKYFEGELSEAEESALWEEMESNPDLMQQYENYAATNLLFQSLGEPASFKADSLDSSPSNKTDIEKNRTLEVEFPLANEEMILESLFKNDSSNITSPFSEDILETKGWRFVTPTSFGYDSKNKNKLHKPTKKELTEWLSLIAFCLLYVIVLMILLSLFAKLGEAQ